MPTNQKRTKRSRVSEEDDAILHLFQDPEGEWVKDAPEIWMDTHPYFLIFPHIFLHDHWALLLPRYWSRLNKAQKEYWKKRIREEIDPQWGIAEHIRLLEKVIEEKLLDENYDGSFYYDQMKEMANNIGEKNNGGINGSKLRSTISGK